AEFCAMLAVAAASLEKIALEVRGLQRTEVLEAQEPFGEGQKGSSAMPHKRNPELSERICGLARLIRSNALAALENVALWHERDISHSSVERVILPDGTIALDYLLHLTTFIVEGLEVDPARMAENLELSYGLVYSQRVLLKLKNAGRSWARASSATGCRRRCSSASSGRGSARTTSARSPTGRCSAVGSRSSRSRRSCATSSPGVSPNGRDSRSARRSGSRSSSSTTSPTRSATRCCTTTMSACSRSRRRRSSPG